MDGILVPNTPYAPALRVLFVFAWLVVGGEETEVRLLARALDPSRYRIDVLPCFRKPGMPTQTHAQLRALGVTVDQRAYDLSFEDTVAYLSERMCCYDVVVGCQDVADLYPALERMRLRPPLIEHGGLVREALSGPKHFTSRYVGVCASIRDAAASRMPGREHHAIEIPSMVDLEEFARPDRAGVRAELGLGNDAVLIGWVGRLDSKKRVEDFIAAAALVAAAEPKARFVIVGGADAFMPDYAEYLKILAREKNLGNLLAFLGDRADVPRLLSGFDIFVWLSRGEGMPHVIAEAGAARLPVIATPDNGALQQIEDGVTGLFTPHENPVEAAARILTLIRDPAQRLRLGKALRLAVEERYAVPVVAPQWRALFDAVRGEAAPAPSPSVFHGFQQGGFECSTHRLRNGERLDLIASTGHDMNAENDYRQLAEHGMRTARDGVRWHRIETVPGAYDFSGFAPMLEAARNAKIQIIWDVMHYGWPDDLDIWSTGFVTRFARFARALGRFVYEHSDGVPFWCPVNEISFLSWAGGDAAYLNPFAHGRGFELKVQLARASMAAMTELRAIDPRARFVHCEPAIAIHHDPARAHPHHEARGWHEAQFPAFDLIAGRLWPQIGGHPDFLDIVGLNYYSNNQWIHGGPPIDIGHPLYRPFSDLLFTAHARYGRPILVAETGIEGHRRAHWARHIAVEVNQARRRGVPVEGVCFYPIVCHKGWDNERICPNGLLGMTPDQDGRRSVHLPLAEAFQDIRAYDFSGVQASREKQTA